MITPADEEFLRRAIAIAAHAVTLGDAPYGSCWSARTARSSPRPTTRYDATTTSAPTRN